MEVGIVLENRYRIIKHLGKGSCADVWEVEDINTNNDHKAVKICGSHDPEIVEQFRREFWILKNLNCDRIIKVESLYPKKEPLKPCNPNDLHFFVMERVRGNSLKSLYAEAWSTAPKQHKISFWKNIYQILFNHYPPLRSPFSYLLIADCLEQLAETLKYLHCRPSSLPIVHCDIKPENILITEDGNIKLIDFGVVIELTNSNDKERFYVDSKSVGYTVGYGAPELKNSPVTVQFDHYSLGKTILFALTGKAPFEVPEQWELQVPSDLVDFIKQTTDENPAKRHQSTDQLWHHAKKVTRSLRHQFGRWAVARQMAVVVGIAAIATISTLALRSTGILQRPEFAFYDQMLAMRPDRQADPRLLIVAIKPDDYQWMGGKDVSNVVLTKALKNLLISNPRTIGIALQRDQPEQNGLIELEQILKKNNHIFGNCLDADPSFPFKPNPSTPLGLSNVNKDADQYIRRHLLFYRDNFQSQCTAQASFSLLIANHYLGTRFDHARNIDSQNYRLKSSLFQSLKPSEGAYQGKQIEREYLNDTFQIMIDYRSRNIAEIVSFKKVIDGKISADKIRDRIVLIGRIDRFDIANHLTPYGEMSGVELYAQIISQFIRSTESNSSVIQPASLMMDLYFVSSLALLSGYLGWRWRSWRQSIIIWISMPFSLYLACFLILAMQGVWFAFIPSLLAVAIANFGVFVYTLDRYKIIYAVFKKMST